LYAFFFNHPFLKEHRSGNQHRYLDQNKNYKIALNSGFVKKNTPSDLSVRGIAMVSFLLGPALLKEGIGCHTSLRACAVVIGHQTMAWW